VGINTAIVAEGKGIGFAIPINMAKDIAPQLQEKGHVTRGWLGVSIQEMTPELAKSLGLKEDSKGALVAQVVPGSPAEKAGIAQGDVIVEFGGKAIAESKDLPQIVASTAVGKSVDVKLVRDGKALDRQVKISEMEENVTVNNAPARKTLGIAVQNLTPEMARRLRLTIESGVVVTRVESGSPAADAGIQTGDIIREVNRKPVKDADDLVQKIEQVKDQSSILLLVQRGQNNLFAAVTPK
jgi:serine protease Do